MREPITTENNKIERHGDDGRHQRLHPDPHKAVDLFSPRCFKGVQPSKAAPCAISFVFHAPATQTVLPDGWLYYAYLIPYPRSLSWLKDCQPLLA